MRRKSVALPGVAVTLIACPWGHYDARPCKRFVRSYVATICRPLASVHRFSGRTFCSSGGINPGEEMHFSRFRRKASGTGEGPRLRRLVAGGLRGPGSRAAHNLKHSGPTGCHRSSVPRTFVPLLGTSFCSFSRSVVCSLGTCRILASALPVQRADEKDIPKSGANIPLSLRALQKHLCQGAFVACMRRARRVC